jgi:hypothetical protein
MSPRIALALVAIVAHAGAARARPGRCPVAEADVTMPAACVGEASHVAVGFCFAPDDGCSGSGLVVGVDAPDAPFRLVDLVVTGPLGSASVGGFPVTLLRGERLVARVDAVPTAAGEEKGRLVWRVREGFTADTADCRVTLRVSSPSCAAPVAGDPCSGQTCAAGACVPPPDGIPCDDGDPCTVGDACASGTCRAGRRLSCADDGDPCTTPVCTPTGCAQVPATGPACDDGDACTVDDHCEAGTCVGRARRCQADGVACTEERCVDGACRSLPLDARCGDDACTRGVCRPGDPAAGRDGCVSMPVGEGELCTDDGFACTDDVCTAGGCLHVPVDTRCGVPGECTTAHCAPERPDADAAGCVVERQASAACVEDGDPCTDDRCAADRCLHAAVPDAAACAPVTPAFRKALGLAALARGLGADVGAPADASGTLRAATVATLTGPLTRVDAALQAAAAALAGRLAAPADAGTRLFAETPAQQRARIALTQVLRTPRQVRTFLQAVAQARAHAELDGAHAARLRRRGRLLLRGTKTLKGDLRRLRRVSQTFAR